MNQVVSGGDSNQGQQQKAEPQIEIIEEGGQAAPQADKGQQQGAGQGYDYPDDDTDGGQGDDSRTGAVAGGGETAQQAGSQQQANQNDLTARQRRRQREREARTRERTELVTLRRQVADLQSRFVEQDSRISSSEAASLDQQIASLNAEVQKASMVMSRAMAAQNPEDFEKALQIRDALKDQLSGLKTQKTQFDQGRQDDRGSQGQQQSGNGMTAAQLQYARIFLSRHPWYKHGSNDQDSQIVVQLDNELTAQGSDPSKPEHWMELERMVREDMPHKFQSAATSDDQQGGQGRQKVNSGNGQANGAGNARGAGGPKLPGSGNAGGSVGGGGPIKFHLSAARKQALIDLGVWDDPAQRMKHVKRFIEWDKSNGGT